MVFAGFLRLSSYAKLKASLIAGGFNGKGQRRSRGTRPSSAGRIGRKNWRHRPPGFAAFLKEKQKWQRKRKIH